MPSMMNRDQAAALLGVPSEADAATVRRAWRFWARIAHPDVGGDPAHFAELEAARQILLRPQPVVVEQQPPRKSLREMLRRAPHPRSLALALVAAIATATLPSFPSIPLAVAAVPAALAATGWARWATWELLVSSADRGHRIELLALLWLPLVIVQLAVSILIGTSLLPVLPLCAVPLAAAVAALQPGAGLWIPVRGNRGFTQ